MTAKMAIISVLGSLNLMLSPALFGAGDRKATFSQKCGPCHGPDGSGDTELGKRHKVRDLRSAEVQAQTDTQLSDIITKGKGKMPAYESGLDKDTLHSVIGYIREIGQKK